MVVGTITTTYHHYNCEFESCSWRVVLYTTLCYKICQWLAASWWFYPGTLVSPPIKLIATIKQKYCWFKWH